MKAWCVKCRKKVDMKDLLTTTRTNVVSVHKGKCTVCGQSVVSIATEKGKQQ